jgi:2-isopropylmalate synthase
MRRVVFGMSQDEVIDLAVTHCRMIRKLAEARPETEWIFQYSPEMFSGTEIEFSKRIVDAVVEEFGATPDRKIIINLPSTVECATANIFGRPDRMDASQPREARFDRAVGASAQRSRHRAPAAAEFAMMAGVDRVEGMPVRQRRADRQRRHRQPRDQHVCAGRASGTRLFRHRRDPPRGRVLQPASRALPSSRMSATSSTRRSPARTRTRSRRRSARARKTTSGTCRISRSIRWTSGRSYEAVIRVNSQSGKGGVAYLLQHEYGVDLPRRMQIEFSAVVQKVTDETGRELSAADLWQIFTTSTWPIRRRWR